MLVGYDVKDVISHAILDLLFWISGLNYFTEIQIKPEYLWHVQIRELLQLDEEN